MLASHDKILKVIQSCKTKLHLITAQKMIDLFEVKFYNEWKYEPIYFRALESAIFIKEYEIV